MKYRYIGETDYFEDRYIGETDYFEEGDFIHNEIYELDNYEFWLDTTLDELVCRG